MGKRETKDQHDGYLIGSPPIPDETRNAHRLVCNAGVWRVSPVVTLDRPLGGWYRSGFSYRIVGGLADGDDLYLRADHAIEEAERRNKRSGDWDGR